MKNKKEYKFPWCEKDSEAVITFGNYSDTSDPYKCAELFATPEKRFPIEIEQKYGDTRTFRRFGFTVHFEVYKTRTEEDKANGINEMKEPTREEFVKFLRQLADDAEKAGEDGK